MERLVPTPGLIRTWRTIRTPDPPPPHIPSLIVCMTEHDAVFEHEVARAAPKPGRDRTRQLEAAWASSTNRRFVVLANSETGVIQPIAENRDLVLTRAWRSCWSMPRKRSAVFLVSISRSRCYIFLVVSSHKLGGPSRHRRAHSRARRAVPHDALRRRSERGRRPRNGERPRNGWFRHRGRMGDARHGGGKQNACAICATA